jgi:hypothetical protein
MANNSAPSGYAMIQRENAKYAMGSFVCLKGEATTTSAMTVTGLLARDIVVGCINLSDATAAQGSVAAMTPSANALAAGSEIWAIGEHYVVVAYRSQS